ncbi:AraC family transcriptional regulator [Actinomadura madurae]|uniref:AraC family transcriptional regulator n=1 Tax=Actinomadura madurae TaxID=1993 RepID=UPI002026CB42|nr:AraC family transcriptional regulator [Actinomadura madurae]MCP9964900.1 AraC family transcriptional regulator [Actinomadura madurae]MCP9977387.1 AraC family transcriptional regulator [Actinomadura madurae]MCQ0011107.1 AraC family transcriptional regulator [Actinomadura madurae]MCQ0013568.1 AraC family transcriptional regulator [Actinomadura madurae]URN04521.1 AraC family transcriptional regulator [Actinomadura madurae]
MGHPLGDGTPVYRYRQRPGLPAVSVMRFNTETAHADLPPGHRHAHDFLVLVYIEEGAGLVTVDGTERPLRAGQVHAVAPGQVIGITTVAELSRGRAWAVAFTADAVPALASVSPLTWTHHPLLALFAPGAGHARVAEPDRAAWSAWLADLDGELADPGRLGAREAAAAALTRLLVAAARLAPAAPGSPDPLVERVFTEIEARFREAVSAADIARALGYTPGYLTTVLRRRTGRPLLDWITERRMIEVRRLLRRTDLPLDAVAARTGLGDATYLVRRFRNRYGVTPQRWRHAERRGP